MTSTMYANSALDASFDGQSSGFILSNFQTNPTFKRNLQFQEYSSPKDWENFPFSRSNDTRVESNFAEGIDLEALDFDKPSNEHFVVVNASAPYKFLYASQGWLDLMQFSAEELDSQNLCWVIGNNIEAVRPLISAECAGSEACILLVSRSGKAIKVRVSASATSEWKGVQSCTLTMIPEQDSSPGCAHDNVQQLTANTHRFAKQDNAGSDWESCSSPYTAARTPLQACQQLKNLQFEESPISVTQHSFLFVPPLDEPRNSSAVWQAPAHQNFAFQSEPARFAVERRSSPDGSCSSVSSPASPLSPLKRSRCMMSSDCGPVPTLAHSEAEAKLCDEAETASAMLPEDAGCKKAKPAPRNVLRLVPRRKGGKDGQGEEEAGGRGGKAVELTRAKIDEMVGKSLKQAAAEMGLAASTLKKACRRIGIDRWPHRPETVTPPLPPSLLYDSAYVRRLQCKYAEGKGPKAGAPSPVSPVVRP